jgi:Kyakuja-Dileera-Zisupton transposase
MCESELRAVDHANTKFSKGYQATGVGGVICARHSLVRKNGLGDLQKGERFVWAFFDAPCILKWS